MITKSSPPNGLAHCEVTQARNLYHKSCAKMNVDGVRAAREAADDYLLCVAANALSAGQTPVFQGTDQFYALRPSSVNDQCYCLTCFCETAILWSEDPVELLDLPNHINGLFVDGASEADAALRLVRLSTLEKALNAQERMAADGTLVQTDEQEDGVNEERGYAVFRALAALREAQSVSVPGLYLALHKGVAQVHYNRVFLAAFDGRRGLDNTTNALQGVASEFVRSAITQVGNQLVRRFPEQVSFDAQSAAERASAGSTDHLIQICVGGTVGEIELHFDRGLPSATLRTGTPDNPMDYLSASMMDETLDGLALKLQSTLELHQQLQSTNTVVREPQRNSVIFSRLDLRQVSSHLAQSAPPHRGWSQGH